MGVLVGWDRVHFDPYPSKMALLGSKSVKSYLDWGRWGVPGVNMPPGVRWGDGVYIY